MLLHSLIVCVGISMYVTCETVFAMFVFYLFISRKKMESHVLVTDSSTTKLGAQWVFFLSEFIFTFQLNYQKNIGLVCIFQYPGTEPIGTQIIFERCLSVDFIFVIRCLKIRCYEMDGLQNDCIFYVIAL